MKLRGTGLLLWWAVLLSNFTKCCKITAASLSAQASSRNVSSLVARPGVHDLVGGDAEVVRVCPDRAWPIHCHAHHFAAFSGSLGLAVAGTLFVDEDLAAVAGGPSGSCCVDGPGASLYFFCITLPLSLSAIFAVPLLRDVADLVEQEIWAEVELLPSLRWEPL